MTNVLKEPYELSIWRDIVNGDSIIEEKRYIIGTDTMCAPSRAFDLTLTVDIYGNQNLEFTMYSKYYNEDGVLETNPYIEELYNEGKIKLKYLNNWYDFVIKEISEAHEKTYKITYKCISLAINELSKTGYDITFSEELSNNVQKINEYLDATLTGTAWQYDITSADLSETSEELAYYSSRLGSVNVRLFKIKRDSNLIYKKLYLNSSLEEVSEAVNTQIDSSWFLAIPFYEKLRATATSTGWFDGLCTLSENIEYDANFAITNGIYCEVDYNIASATSVCKYRIKRPVKNSILIYNSKLEKYVDVYKKDGSNITYYGVDVYRVTPTLRVFSKSKESLGIIMSNAPTNTALYRFYQKNGSIYDFKKMTILSAYKYESLSINTAYTFRVVPVDYLERPFDSSGNPVENISWSNPNFSQFVSYDIEATTLANVTTATAEAWLTDSAGTTFVSPVNKTALYLLNRSKTLKATMITSGWSDFLDDYTVLYAQLYSNKAGTRIITVTPILMIQVGNVYTTRILSPIELSLYANSLLELQDMSLPITIEGNYTTANMLLHVDSTLQLANTFKSTLYLMSEIYVNRTETNYTYEEFLTDTDITVIETEISGNWKRLYYRSDDEDTLLTSLPEGYVLQESYEKLRTFEVEKSNRFNITLSLSETFEVWCRYIIEHDNDGRITLVNGIPLKKIKIVDNYGLFNNIGFIYGINLNKITRDIKSDEIVTKLYVEDIENTNLTYGYCSITNASDNPNKSNFLIDFSYYIKKGILDESSFLTYLYNTYYSTLYDKLVSYDNYYTELYGNGENSLSNQKLVVDNNILVYLSKISSLNEKILTLKELGSSTTSVELELALAKMDEQCYRAKSVIINALINTCKNKLSELLTNIKNAHNTFYAKYGNFISEGTWTGEHYTNDNTYFYDAQKVITRNALPLISYSLDIIDVHNQIDAETNWEYSPYVFNLGDISNILDKLYFGNDKALVVISQIEYYLDLPLKNSITILNYSTQFEDLFLTLNASVLSLTLNLNTYAKSENFTSGGTLSAASLLSSFNKNKELAIANADSSYTLDNTGITLSSGTSIVKLLGGGLILSNDNGATWQTGIYGGEINTNLLRAGTIDTERINIFTGKVGETDESPYIWDKYGLNAYYNDSLLIAYNRKVTFNQYGIYGFYDANGDISRGGSDGINRSNILTSDKILFALTDLGLRINIKDSGRYYRSVVDTSSNNYIFANANYETYYDIYDANNELKRSSIRPVDDTGTYFAKKISGTLVTYYFMPNYKYKIGNTYQRVFTINDADIDDIYIYNSLTGIRDLCKMTWDENNFVIENGVYGKLYKFKTGEGVPNYYYTKAISTTVELDNILINVNDKFLVYGDGSINATNGTFSGTLVAATGSFSGTLVAATGSFSGTVAADDFLLNGTSVKLKLLDVMDLINKDSDSASFTLTSNNITYGSLAITSAVSAETGVELMAKGALRVRAAEGNIFIGCGSTGNYKPYILLNKSTGRLTLYGDSIYYLIAGSDPRALSNIATFG